MAARLFAATHQPMEKYARNLSYADLDWNEKEAYGLNSMNTLLMR